jgi:hypothetical protein
VGFAVYGIALFLRGTIQARPGLEAFSRPTHAQRLGDIVLASAGPLLGLAVIALITLA